MQRILFIGIMAIVLGGSSPSAGAAPGLASAAATSAPVPQLTSGAQVDAYLTKAHFHGYILLVRHGRTILSKGYGMADAQHRVPSTLRTRWPMFDIEDFMVAMAILKLQEEGKLRLQDAFCKYMSGCPKVWRGITIREMLGGTSRIGQYDPFASVGTITHTIAQCKAAPLLPAPAGVSEDSACNRVLLSRVIERVSRKPFGTAVQQMVFDPAGMTSTRLESRVPSGSAHGYNGGFAAPPLHDGGYPLIYSTPGDLQRLARALLGGKIVSLRSVAALITPYRHVGDPTVTVFSGYGCQVLKANQFFFHFGSTAKSTLKTNRAVFESGGVDWSGFLTDSWFSPDDGTVAIWLNNDTGRFDNDADNRFLDRTAQLLWGK